MGRLSIKKESNVKTFLECWTLKRRIKKEDLKKGARMNR